MDEIATLLAGAPALLHPADVRAACEAYARRLLEMQEQAWKRYTGRHGQLRTVIGQRLRYRKRRRDARIMAKTAPE